ncbi:uncharacterized protein conserved in bacteria [Methylophaga aminisulfidivorans MP]|uniref:Uncharacterized protein conserved in bacteria n=1 Tax=Methylophaga aminisulfidivorans MP TaxID=1026882 RepID=F5SVS1_9GAMM|nr:DNA recombination protein RmuC [Methylophaga aminisulfidivorans]EGL55643.1 uncharacterized protein conserved in bacteria [Methylophaga aminisulfidivorans MP]
MLESLSPDQLIGLLVIVGCVSAALAYLLFALRHSRKLTALQSQLYELQLSHSRQEQQLQTAFSTESRLTETVAEYKQQVQQLNQSLEQTKQQLHQAEKHFETAQANNQSLQQQFSDKKTELQQQLDAFQELQQAYQSLSNQHTELKTTLERREEHFKEQMAQLAETKQAMTKEFENLANKIFEEKGKTFTDTSKSSIDVLLKPFREQIEGFQKRINEVHDASIKGNTNLNAEIKKVLDIGLKMSEDAHNLTSALKGDSQQRGAWGEAQLRRTLEMSGLIEDAHFEVQTAFKDNEGKQKQTDYLIKLPDNKHIIIDSKVSLNAYDRAVSAETPEAYTVAMADHVRAVRKHIDDLASKDYTNVVGMRSPSFVLMFMPIEPAYIEALKNNKDLFEYGYKKGIVLVSHTTLIPILRTVSNLWMMERSNAEAREISEKAGDIYNQVAIVAERLQKLGNTLGTVSNQYNQVIKGVAGKQGLYGKVDRFGQLSTKVSKSLPQLETIERDYETEPLTMIVEAIEEEDEAHLLPHSEQQTSANE